VYPIRVWAGLVEIGPLGVDVAA
ncbi:nitrite reductase (NAD(P)H) small subunit, partial [Mycobacterium sp. CBMA361]|nr:nitrite reductase (NAD(P)H) small subunit [Mycolicibacterium sp. CBMA 361]